MHDVALYLTWLINREYIAAELCVNRNTANQQCHGRCVLSKMQQEQQEQEPMQSPRPAFEDRPSFVWILAESYKVVLPMEQQRQKAYCVLHTKEINWHPSVFHPPRRSA
jgi:hypothetical protein